MYVQDYVTLNKSIMTLKLFMKFFMAKKSKKLNVTLSQLSEYLLSLKSACPATIVANTVPKMNKTGNPYYDRIHKISNTQTFVNFVYGKAVNKRRAKESKVPDFVPSERVWGERIKGTPLVTYKDKLYVEAMCLNSLETVYINEDGIAVEKETLKPYLVKARASNTQDLNTEVYVRDYKLDNIVQMTINGYVLTVVDE